MRAWRDRNSAPQRITSLMVVFDPTGVLWCFCFTVFSLLLSLSRVRFTPSECHSSEKMIVKFFLFLTNAIAQFQSAVVVLSSQSLVYQRVPWEARPKRLSVVPPWASKKTGGFVICLSSTQASDQGRQTQVHAPWQRKLVAALSSTLFSFIMLIPTELIIMSEQGRSLLRAILGMTPRLWRSFYMHFRRAFFVIPLLLCLLLFLCHTNRYQPWRFS